jgi:phage terminase small subunit
MAKKKEEHRVVNSFEENKELREKIYDDIFGDSDLTDKQKDFVMLYLSNSNPTISYFSAFNVKNKKTAGVLGNMEIKKPKIQAALKRAKKLMAYTLDIDPLEYVEYNLKIAKADIGDYMSFYT